jgi:copper chaperone CopZ
MFCKRITYSVFSLFVLAFLPLLCFGQFKSAEIGVDGLTCSACTRSVEMSIRKLNFVRDVVMNLENTEGKIIFKDSVKIEIDKIAKAVTDAGFSVRYLHASFNFNNIPVSENFCWNYEGGQYQFVKTEDKKLNGVVTLKFIGEKYLSKKEIKKWSAIISSAKGKGCNAKNIYYVTL